LVAEHLLQWGVGGRWDRHDVIAHAYLGLTLGAIAYASGSWLDAAIGHTL
jgi:hypothetical protein